MVLMKCSYFLMLQLVFNTTPTPTSCGPITLSPWLNKEVSCYTLEGFMEIWMTVRTGVRWVPPHIPGKFGWLTTPAEELLAIGSCWWQGDLFFRGVSTGRLPMNWEMCPCLYTYKHSLGSVGFSILILIQFFFFFTCMGILPVCVSMHHVCA